MITIMILPLSISVVSLGLLVLLPIPISVSVLALLQILREICFPVKHLARLKLPPFAEASALPTKPLSRRVVAVTGSASFLGQHLLQLLSSSKEYDEVRGLYHSKQGAFILHLTMVKYFRIEVDDEASLTQALKDVTTVYHLVSSFELRDYIERKQNQMYNINVVGTMNVINACLHCQVRQLVFVGSMSMHVDKHSWLSPYGAGQTKRQAQQLVMAANGRGVLQTICVDLGLVYGRGDENFTNSCLEASVIPIVGDGSTKFCWIYAKNAVNCLERAAQHLQEKPDLFGGQVFSAFDADSCLTWAEMIEKFANARRVKTTRVSEKLLTVFSLLILVLDLYTRGTLESELFSLVPRALEENKTTNILESTTKNLLEYTQVFSLDEAISDTVFV